MYLEAPVRDDARLAGGEIIIRSDVFGDVVVGGGKLEITEGATIHGDLYIGGGEVRIAGKVLGKIDVAGGEIIFSGEAMNAVKMQAGELTVDGVIRGPAQLVGRKINLGSGAQFHDQINYWCRAGEMDFGPALVGKGRSNIR